MYTVQENWEEVCSEFNLSITNNRQSLGANLKASALIKETDKRINNTSSSSLLFTLFLSMGGEKKGKLDTWPSYCGQNSPRLYLILIYCDWLKRTMNCKGARKGDIERMKELKEKAGVGKASGWSVMEDNPDYLWQEGALIYSCAHSHDICLFVGKASKQSKQAVSPQCHKSLQPLYYPSCGTI